MPYQLIYADPAWEYGSKISNRAAKNHYSTMNIYGDESRIELFARAAVNGWDCWGHQCDSCVQLSAGRVA